MYTRRFRGYVHERAIFGWCNTRHCAFRFVDERSVVSQRATRAVDGAALQASCECKGIPACVCDCPKHAQGVHSLAQPLRAHTWLDVAHLMGERWVTQTRDARAMRGAIASTIYDCKGLAARFWHGQSTRAERSYGRVHEHATQDRCSARYDAF